MPYVIQVLINGKKGNILRPKGGDGYLKAKMDVDRRVKMAVEERGCKKAGPSAVRDQNNTLVDLAIVESAWFVIRDIIRQQLAEHGGLCGDHPEGLCRKCGEEAYNVEPDARRYACEGCGAREVFGFEELAMDYDARGQL